MTNNLDDISTIHNEIIQVFEETTPPIRLRDELVVAFEWAWYGQDVLASTKSAGA